MQFQFKEAEDNAGLDTGKWQMLHRTGSDELSGRIRVRLGNSLDAKRMEETIHSMPISVGGELVAITVSNPCLQKLPSCNSGKD